MLALKGAAGKRLTYRQPETVSLRSMVERRRRALRAHKAWARRHKIKPASDPNATGDLFDE